MNAKELARGLGIEELVRGCCDLVVKRVPL
jgi:hypothetical protein